MPPTMRNTGDSEGLVDLIRLPTYINRLLTFRPVGRTAMYAAVVTSFDVAPSYQEFPTPTPQGSDEVLVDVVAAGLHRRVRSQADGSHYTSTGQLPLVPGVDGVGRMSDGTLRYFALGDTTSGAMAEQTVIDLRRSFVLPDGTDPVLVAAAMNPAMSSSVALRRRTTFEAGQTVLVLGATGSPARWPCRSPSGSAQPVWSPPDAIPGGWPISPNSAPTPSCGSARRTRRDR